MKSIRQWDIYYEYHMSLKFNTQLAKILKFEKLQCIINKLTHVIELKYF
jgi:hypothetical protein